MPATDTKYTPEQVKYAGFTDYELYVLEFKLAVERSVLHPNDITKECVKLHKEIETEIDRRDNGEFK